MKGDARAVVAEIGLARRKPEIHHLAAARGLTFGIGRDNFEDLQRRRPAGIAVVVSDHKASVLRDERRRHVANDFRAQSHRRRRLDRDSIAGSIKPVVDDAESGRRRLTRARKHHSVRDVFAPVGRTPRHDADRLVIHVVHVR